MPCSHNLTPVTSLSPIPTPTTITRCTHSSSHNAMLCTPSLCHLFVDCWHVCLCFVSPFSFFMHSTTLRRSSASPANSSMFSPPAHCRLAFIPRPASFLVLLIVLLILSPHLDRPSGCFELRLFSSLSGMPPYATCLHFRTQSALIKSLSGRLIWCFLLFA